jgi:hypothetical protein
LLVCAILKFPTRRPTTSHADVASTDDDDAE